jgi:YVTN family beta-propeller protein
MDIRLLGAIEASEDGISFSLGGPRQRAVLADLALHAGHVVSTGQLAEDLWGGGPPATAKRTLESYIYRLRQELGASGADGTPLVTRPTGYLLDIAPDRVDIWQFRDLAARGRAAMEHGDAATAVTLLRAAIGLCRGPALADIQDAAFAPTAAHRLGEERLTAVESLVGARLALGQHRELVPELETLIEKSPYRERFYAQLMLALYRSGRQADALAAYARARTLLAGELGIEPGRELRELHRAVLLQGPELEPRKDGAAGRAGVPSAAPGAADRVADRQPSAPDAPPATGPVVPRRRRAWRWAAVLGVLVLAAAVVVPVVLTGRHAQGTLLVDGVGEVTTAGSVTRSLGLPDPPGAAVAADGSVWAASPEGNVVYRIDPVTASLVQTIPVAGGPSAIAANGPDIWVASALDGTVSRISAATSQVVQTIHAGVEPTGIAVGGGAIWVADAGASTLVALSPVSGRPMTTVPLAAAPFGVAFGAGSVWVTSPGTDSLTRIDPRSMRAGQQILVGAGPTAVTAGLGSVWVANSLDSTVTRVNPATDAVTATVPVGDGPDALAVAGGSVWVAARLGATLTRISAHGVPTAAIPVGGSPVGLTTASGTRGGVWVAAGSPASSRPAGGTLRAVSDVPPSSIDPALIYPLEFALFSAATYDTLVTFQKTAGSSGLQLVPDLALAMPTVTGGGTVYTFTLRPGLRYSTGRPVQPADFRYAIERVLALNPTAAAFLNGIEGASACAPRRLCDLAHGIMVDNSARTVTFHLTAPDPAFLDKLAFEFTTPVPSYVPATEPSRAPVPCTGPYMITRYVPRHLVVFARNPHFREWSAAAQPAGSPDRIVWTFGLSLAREAAEIEAGQADWTNDQLPDVAGLAARFPAQVHINPLPAIVYTSFNTRVAPFNHPQVRRAFSLAADRDRFVALLGGPDQATPACQILPPGIPGHRPYCPFTANPAPSGAWTGPDLATARKLVAASGTRGMRVTVWSDNLSGDPAIGAFTVSVLRELGYRATLHMASHAAVEQATNDSRRRIQATGSEWFADYPSASDFLDLFFRCSASHLDDPAATRNGSFFCDPAADRLMTIADREQATNPQRAAATWAKADQMVTYAAPWVILANLNNVDFLSARVTNYQYNPFLGVLLDQLQIRSRQPLPQPHSPA